MIKRTRGTGILLSIAISGLLMLTASPVRAVTINVNSTEDVIADDGKCTLREAVIAANTDTASGSMNGECPAGYGDDKIVLQVGVYSLTIEGTREDNAQTGDLDILDDLTITGTKADETIIDANGIDRVFEVMSGVGANFKGIAITDGWVYADSGGGIFNKGTLKIAKCTISDNAASSANYSDYGGGIYNDANGTITITKSTVSGNTAFSTNYSAYGGGIYSNGTLSITYSKVSDNTSSGYYASGGGIYSNGTMKIASSKVSRNTASGDYAYGGGIYGYANGTTKITYSKVSRNTASADNYAYGGGVFNFTNGTMKITYSKVSRNTASANNSAYGSGIYNNGTIKIISSKVSYNTATGEISANGGGIYNSTNGTIMVKGVSRISGNEADNGGGVYDTGTFNKSGQTRINDNVPDDIVKVGP